MKILYFHQFFNTPEKGGSIRSYLLSQGLKSKNHHVIIITSHNEAKQTVIVDDIEVRYLKVRYKNEFKFWRRIISYSSYTIQAIFESFKIKSVDLCYVMTTPLLTGFIGLFNKFIKKRPYIFEVGDLWPTVPIDMGFINSPFLKIFTKWIEQLFYRNAIGNIGLSLEISQHIHSISSKNELTTISNISDCNYYEMYEPDQDFLANHGIKDKFIIAYTGTFGLANDLFRVLDLAKEVNHLPIQFILIGSGADRPELIRQSSNLENVSVLDHMSKEEVAHWVINSDAMLVSFADYPSLWTGSPNKYFDALAAGKLVITNFGGWVAKEIEKNQCGFSFDHKKTNDFKEKITAFVNNTEHLKLFQQNARKLAKEKYELHDIVDRHEQFVSEVVVESQKK